jgi:hypothetical protein
MHCSVPAGQLPSVRAVKPPPTGSGQAAPHGSAIYRAHQQTPRTSPEIQPDCPLSLVSHLGLLQTSYLLVSVPQPSRYHATWKQH